MEFCRAGLRTTYSILTSPAFRRTTVAHAATKAKAAPKKKQVVVKKPGGKSKTGKTVKAKVEPTKGKFDGILDKFLQDARSDVVPEVPDEQQRQKEREMASEYSRLLIRQHRQEMQALNIQIQLKEAAIAALPTELQAAARVPDFTPFPINRMAATLSPPISGYVEETAKEAERAASSMKSR